MISLYSLFHVLVLDGLWHFEGCSDACVVSQQQTSLILLDLDICLYFSYLSVFFLNLKQTEAHNPTKIMIDIQRLMYDTFTFQHIMTLVQMPYQRSVPKSIFPSSMLTSL